MKWLLILFSLFSLSPVNAFDDGHLKILRDYELKQSSTLSLSTSKLIRWVLKFSYHQKEFSPPQFRQGAQRVFEAIQNSDVSYQEIYRPLALRFFQRMLATIRSHKLELIQFETSKLTALFIDFHRYLTGPGVFESYHLYLLTELGQIYKSATARGMERSPEVTLEFVETSKIFRNPHIFAILIGERSAPWLNDIIAEDFFTKRLKEMNFQAEEGSFAKFSDESSVLFRLAEDENDKTITSTSISAAILEINASFAKITSLAELNNKSSKYVKLFFTLMGQNQTVEKIALGLNLMRVVDYERQILMTDFMESFFSVQSKSQAIKLFAKANLLLEEVIGEKNSILLEIQNQKPSELTKTKISLWKTWFNRYRDQRCFSVFAESIDSRIK